MQAKEGETVDVGDSQSKTVLAEYPQTVEVPSSPLENEVLILSR